MSKELPTLPYIPLRNKKEVESALKNNYVLKHKHFISKEFICQVDEETYMFEDGITVNKSNFWDLRDSEDWEKDWEIIGTLNLDGKIELWWNF